MLVQKELTGNLKFEFEFEFYSIVIIHGYCALATSEGSRFPLSESKKRSE